MSAVTSNLSGRIRKLNIYIFNPGCYTVITGEQPLYIGDLHPPLSSQEVSHYSFFSTQLTRQERCGVPVSMYCPENTRPFHPPQLRRRILRADEAKLSQLGKHGQQRSDSSLELACVWWGKSNLIIWDWKEIQSDCFEIKNTGGRSAGCKGQLGAAHCVRQRLNTKRHHASGEAHRDHAFYEQNTVTAI